MHEEFLFAALRSPFGVVIKTDDPNRVRLRLATAKQKQPGVFATVSICHSRTDPDGEVWIVRNTGDEPRAQEE